MIYKSVEELKKEAHIKECEKDKDHKCSFCADTGPFCEYGHECTSKCRREGCPCQEDHKCNMTIL